MLKGIFETHAHMDDPCYEKQIDQVMQKQKDAGVEGIITSGSELSSSLRSIALAEKYDFVYATVGIYPNETENLPEDYIEQLRNMALKSKKVVGIGEIGMDYGFEGYPDPAVQELRFREQLKLAEELDLPVVIHDRDADEDTLRIIRDYKIRGEIHRIFSPVKYADAFMEYGLSVAVGPQITYPNSECLVEMVKHMSLDKLLLETDAPFLPPAHLAGSPAYPDMISHVAEKIAEIRGDVTAQEVIDIANKNARELFRIS